ncbi:MAG TPA: acyl-CoA dehydrogenase family protein [Pseudomonadales bacterium]|jgi:alkylation response protein AidB-like acyl-CoA dehydrogenase|nr:acyl-CoA dehydrogenase family protein [Pseudomonadales bacterium]MDP6315519.1 acyl-CoA dehydrogenase family protein [Pseudomonadales bacterium]MDP7315024.1 acyl-CoA dehydrogenase family protein [Pseudomonadales bacterium]MDP7576773.1 acyl-CoA dehydrogenase family protein [Pseudomonadales bacterium]HJL61285.1 acyl-CoA dehydrogenase family protein [Pseudomonadales bacterium]|tara:strand:- start:186 stop:1373 length:1188 start_codon:yes stop_codon:yes gene_type:complete
MDLSFGSEYEEFREEVRRFVEEHKGKTVPAAPRSKDGIAWQKTLIENGYAARTIPKEYGGYGAEPDIIKSRIIAEEFGRVQLNTGLGGQGISMLTPVLLEMGTEEQKQQFIKPTIHGEMIWCQGYSEPGAGSDLASLTTKAELDGDTWVINGQKIWTSTAKQADWIFCLVRSEPNAPKHQGISFLLFKMDTPGIEIRPLVDMTMNANFNEVFFTDVRVPKDQIVGKRGEGWQVANAILGHERGSLAPPDAAQSRLNALVKMMQEETIGGERLIDNPQYRERLMQLQGRVLAMKFNDMRLLSARINKNQDAKLAGMIVKLQGTELRHELEGLAIDIMGEIGLSFGRNPYLRGGGSWQYQYMYFLGLIIGGGTSQIQKNIISERGLGMPKEPKVEAK